MASPDPTSLARLSEGERADLALLAQGHTAKSIAVLTGRTVGSVNERLREARRKTGAASSRELARWLAGVAARESRDELIGVAGSAAIATASHPVAGSERRPIGAAIMISALLASGALLVLHQASPAPGLPADPLTDTFTKSLSPPTPPRDLRRRLLAETRDPTWASAAEATLRRRYLAIPGLSGPRGDLRVTCATTLCEIVGSIPPGSQAATNAVMGPLQGPALHNDLAKLGLNEEGVTFTDTQTRPKQLSFLSYWSRVPAPPASTRP